MTSFDLIDELFSDQKLLSSFPTTFFMKWKKSQIKNHFLQTVIGLGSIQNDGNDIKWTLQKFRQSQGSHQLINVDGIQFAIYDKSSTIATPWTSPYRTEIQDDRDTNLFLNGFLSSICSNFLFRFRSLIKPMSKSGFTFESFKNLSSFSLKNLSNSILKFHSKNISFKIFFSEFSRC